MWMRTEDIVPSDKLTMVRFTHEGSCHLRVQSQVPRHSGRGPQDAETDSCDPLWQACRGSNSPISREGQSAPTGVHGGDGSHSGRYRRSDRQPSGLGGGSRLKLLLDTHIWVWSALAPDRLSARVARQLNKPENEIWLSAVSVWELQLLH